MDAATSAKGRPGLVVLAVDDELPALDEIRYLLGSDPRVGTVLGAADATEALRVLQGAAGQRIDAVLLDIHMPGLDGVELARVLASLRTPPAVAFLSAHDDRAVDAFEVGAVDYLLKPVRRERLAEAIGRLQAQTGGAPVGPAPDERIAVDLAGTTRYVQRSAVCWAQAQGDYARLHTEDGQSHLLRTPLSTLEEQWAAAGFVRVHRGYLVALGRIVELRAADSGYQVRVVGGPAPVDLPVSRRHLRELRQRLLRGPGS